MKKLQRGISVLLAVLMISLSTFVAADTAPSAPAPVWPQYRGDSRMSGVTDAKTPISADQTEEKWKANLNDGWADPSVVILGDALYTVYGNMMTGNCYLQKRSVSDGSVQQQTQLIENIGFFPFITYGDGKLFVSINDGRIEAFDANTLKPLWISQSLYDVIGDDANGQQSLAPIVYYNGYVYTGSTFGNASTGMYYCVPADCNAISPSDSDEWKDDIESASLKVNQFKWTYVPDTGKKGFYWSGGAVAGNSIVFGGDNGELVSHSLTDSAVYDKLDLNTPGYSKSDNPSAVRSTAYYDKKTGRVFVSSKENCTVSSIIVKPDGTFSDSSLIQKQIPGAGNITSSPIVYNGRLYIGSGGMGAGSEFSVLDAKTLDLIYQVPIQTQSTPVLTTAYATAENHNTVYIYVAWYDQNAGNGLSDCIYCIKDYEGNTKPDCTTLITPSVNECNTCTLAVGNDGTLYYKNDSGNLFAFANKNGGAYTAQDEINAINRIPTADNLTLDDEILVERARNRYSELPDSEKSGISNYAALTAAEDEIKLLRDSSTMVANLIQAIGKLPVTVTLDQQQTIYDLLNTYNSLSDADKTAVTNAQKLLDAKAAVDRLSGGKTVDNLVAAIAALPSDIHYDSTAVDAVYKQYTALDDTLKEQIPNAAALEKKEDAFTTIRNTVDTLSQDNWNDIQPVSLSYADKATVESLIIRYNTIDSYDQQFVEHYSSILEAQKTIAEMTATVAGTPAGNGYQAQLSKTSITASTITAELGNVSVSFPDSLLNSLTQNGKLMLTQAPLSDALLSKINAVLGTGKTVFADFSLNLADANGNAVHQLGGSVQVTVHLTDEIYGKIQNAQTAKLYDYDTGTGKLENMSATFDLQKKTVTFSTNHFSDFVIVQNATASTTGATQTQQPGSSSASSGNGAVHISNPDTGEDLRLAPVGLVVLFLAGIAFAFVRRAKKSA